MKSKKDLYDIINKDSRHYSSVIGPKRRWHQLHVNPISDQWYIWRYIKTLRICEYHINKGGFIHELLKLWHLYRLRRISRITGFQIPPNTIGSGLTIWHWGPIIVNPAARIGMNCVLNPMAVIGHKNPGEPAPQIGDNVFIGAGAKIIGNIKIGNNVVIAPNSVVTKNIEENVVVGGIPARIIKRL